MIGSVRNVGVVLTSTEEQGLFLLKKSFLKAPFYRSDINLAASMHTKQRIVALSISSVESYVISCPFCIYASLNIIHKIRCRNLLNLGIP